MKSLRLTMLLLGVLLVRGSGLSMTDFFPDTGKVAITQHALELRERLRIMSIALRPGEEDCAMLSYLRMGRGAQITSVYVTNGEKGDCDTEELLPFDLAAARRMEALKAMLHIDAEAVFVNLPDLDAAASRTEAQLLWNPDTVEFRLRRLIEPTQPDIVLIMSDKQEGDGSAGTAIIREALLRACSRSAWRVRQILFEGDIGGARIPAAKEKHPVLHLPFARIADSIRASYSSLSVQWTQRRDLQVASYTVLYPRGARSVFIQKDAPLAGKIPDSLQALDKQVRDLAAYALRAPIAGKKLVSRILPVLQQIDRSFARFVHAQSREQRIVIDWKDALEKLRCAALGVSVKYSLEYPVLCERQLVRLKLDEIRANVKLASMELVVHEVARGWIVNEALKSRIPVKPGDTLRLITPGKVDYDLPLAQNAQVRPAVGRPFLMTMVHGGVKKEETFVYRIAPRIFFAPRFTAEVLTPIVRGRSGEQLVTRLTNHSRDGVADRLEVADSLASSPAVRVALSSKDAASIDTLSLTWRDSVTESSSVLPLLYGGVPVAHFLARTFACAADTAKRIGVVSGWKSSSLFETLRRLEFLHVRNLSGTNVTIGRLEGVHVLIFDRRALTLRGLSREESLVIRDFVSRGGHLLVLAQEPDAWKLTSLTNSLTVSPSPGLHPNATLRIDTTSAVLSQPNQLCQADFEGWLNRKGYNTVKLVDAKADVFAPVRAPDGAPLLVTIREGKGRLTYVDLALGPQWMNVTPGAFRLLANILSQ